MSSQQASLLLVDDDPAAIQVTGRMLAHYPDQRFATSGEVALRLARESRPDLILMDAEMPGLSGLGVCKALKADPALADVPVIFVTSHDSTALQVAALQEGAADFVSKPLLASQFTARVRAQLRSKALIEDLRRDGRLQGLAARPPPLEQASRVLIVDDDTASIHILRHTLGEMGKLHFAKTGEEALRVTRDVLPDLILLDAHMPGLDGFDVCRTLKADPQFRHVPIAFITRFSDPRYETCALDLGAADFIAKPYTPAVLQARVRNLLELKRRTDAELHAMLERGGIWATHASPRSWGQRPTPSSRTTPMPTSSSSMPRPAACSASRSSRLWAQRLWPCWAKVWRPNSPASGVGRTQRNACLCPATTARGLRWRYPLPASAKAGAG